MSGRITTNMGCVSRGKAGDFARHFRSSISHDRSARGHTGHAGGYVAGEGLPARGVIVMDGGEIGEGIGHRVWVVPGGHIPFPSHGLEPEFTSFDQLCLLNCTDRPAATETTIFYDDQEPTGPYRIVVPARRIRHVRFNDLIDPEAIQLGRPFGAVLRSTEPVVVQFLRQDTRLPGVVALTGTMAFPVPTADERRP